MIDHNTPLKEAFVSALSGLTYEEQSVPVYCEENPNESEKLYIILAEHTDNDRSTKSSFDTQAFILIDIVHHTDGCTYDVVNAVASQVMQTLQPTPQSSGLTSTASLQFATLKRTSSQELKFETTGGNIMRRLLRYQVFVTEK